MDLQGIRFVDHDTHLCVWDSQTSLRLHFYSVFHEELSAIVEPEGYEDRLGLKIVSYSPFSDLVALGTFDDKIFFTNCHSWAELVIYQHEVVTELEDIVWIVLTFWIPLSNFSIFLERFPRNASRHSNLYSHKPHIPKSNSDPFFFPQRHS